MAAKVLKSNKKNKLSKKSIVFWSAIGLAVVVLLILLANTIINNRSIVNYDDLLENNHVAGDRIFDQKEEQYLVLFYGFNNDEAYKDFDKNIFTYLEYYRNNSSEEGVLKMYAADCDDPTNDRICNQISVIDGESNIVGTTASPSNSQASENQKLKINTKDIPALLVVTNGEITAAYTTTHDINEYLHSLKK